MQREISDKVLLGKNVSPFEHTGESGAFDRTASNYNDAKEKVKKIKELIKTGNYDTDIAKYIPGVLEMKYQGMLEDIDTREKVARPSYKDMDELDFQILLTNNYYVNPSSIRICFPMKIKKSTSQTTDIDSNLITVNNFFCSFDKRNNKYNKIWEW